VSDSGDLVEDFAGNDARGARDLLQGTVTVGLLRSFHDSSSREGDRPMQELLG